MNTLLHKINSGMTMLATAILLLSQGVQAQPFSGASSSLSGYAKTDFRPRNACTNL